MSAPAGRRGYVGVAAERAHTPAWVRAQTHAEENIGETDSHALFVELK